MVAQNIGFPNGDSRNADGTALGVQLRREAAGALVMLAFYYEQRFGTKLTASEGMRGIEMQNFYWDRYQNKRPGWTVAAYPGTSQHGWGLAVDFAGRIQSAATVEHAWLAAHAPLFGWEWTGRNFGEPWHFDYTGVNVADEQRQEFIARGVPAPVSTPAAESAPSNNRKKENLMYLVQQSDGDKKVFIMLQTGALHLTSQKQVNSYIEHFTGLGLSGPGYSVPLSRSSESITLISMANEAQANKVLTMPKK